MTTMTRSTRRRARREEDADSRSNKSLARRLPHIPGWLIVVVVIVLLMPDRLLNAVDGVRNAVQNVITAVAPTTLPTLEAITQPITNAVSEVINPPAATGPIAAMFTPEVQYWRDNIARWAAQYSLDPNLLATVMQIESCGHDAISSSAGAQGLFQVMPFHFSLGETMTDPNTNAMRGANFLNVCLDYANGNVNLAMACYNGGPSVVNRAYANWPHETQRYYVWGATVYADAQLGKGSSDSLNSWLNAGGSGLCQRASQHLGI